MLMSVLYSKDVLHEDRVHSDVSEADLSNFLHPVLYYYSQLPNKGTVTM